MVIVKNMSEQKLRPWKNAPVKIPAIIRLEIDGIEEIISYPRYGSIAEKTEYIKLLQSLSLVSQSEDMI